jgi:hypothetical protein
MPFTETVIDIRAQLAFRHLDVIIQPTERQGGSKAIIKAFRGQSLVARSAEQHRSANIIRQTHDIAKRKEPFY